VHGICGVDCDDMFVDMILVRMVQMAIVKVVHMAVVPNRGVPTVWAMPMGVVGMVLLSASGHDFSLSQPRFGNSTRCPRDRTRPAAPAKFVMNREIMQGFEKLAGIRRRCESGRR
jgi:hypothetical protein